MYWMVEIKKRESYMVLKYFTNYLNIVVCEKLLKMYQEVIIRGDSAKIFLK